MTDLTPEARDTLARMTDIPFEVWAPVIVLVILGWIGAALVRAPLDNDAPLSRLDLMDRGCCGAISPEGWTCDRAADHDAGEVVRRHVDSTEGGELGAAHWFEVVGRAA